MAAMKVRALLKPVLLAVLIILSLAIPALLPQPVHCCRDARAAVRPGPISYTRQVREITVHFGPLRPIFDVEGRFLGISAEGCDNLAVSGCPLVPVRVLVFKFDWCSKLVDVEVKTGPVRELGINAKWSPVPSPVPAGASGQEVLKRPEKHEAAGIVPGTWFEHEVHYGLDPKDLELKMFVVIRLFPARYDLAKHEVLSIGWARVKVMALTPLAPRVGQGAMALVITNSDLLPAAERLAAWKNASGLMTVVRTVGWVREHYGGRDIQERIRNFIGDAVEELGVKFVIIFGDQDVVPTRMVYVPDGFQDDEPGGDGALVEADLYYADVLPANFTWNDDNDAYWGELPDEPVDGWPDVMIGRLPASTLDEAQALVDKLMAYWQAAQTGNTSWAHRLVLMGLDLFQGEGYEGPEGEIVKDVVASEAPSGFSIVKLYESFGNLTSSMVEAELGEGCGLANFAGHGDVEAWELGQNDYFSSSDLASLENGPRFPIVIAAACLTARFSDRDCLGERFLLEPYRGAIAYLGATRVAWLCGGQTAAYALAGKLDVLFAKAFFSGASFLGQVWAEGLEDYILACGLIRTWLVNGKSYFLDWKTIAEYGSPLGDPSTVLAGAKTHKLSVLCLDADGKNPVANMTVRLSLGGRLEFENTTGPDGRASFSSLPPGTYVLRAFSYGVKVAEVEVTVPSPGEVVVNCSLLDLNITCVNEGWEPLAGAEVKLEGPGGLVVNGTIRSNGTLRLEDLPTAAYAVKVYWPLAGTRVKVYEGSLELTRDEQAEVLKCRVLSVVLVVVDAWGRPVEGAKVDLYTANGTYVGTFLIGPGGRAELRGLVPGEYLAVVSAELARPVKTRFTAATHGQMVEVRVERFISPIELYFTVAATSTAAAAVGAFWLIRRRRGALRGLPPLPGFY